MPIKQRTRRGSCLYLTLLVSVTALLISAGCEEKSAPPPAVTTPPPVVDDTLTPATIEAWQLGNTYLTGAQASVAQLGDAVQQLLAQPQVSSLAQAREAWHRAHNDYHRFDVFRALAGSSPGLFGDIAALNTPIDSWPIMPGYLDYFDVYTHSGIVNDIAVPITASAIRKQHGFSDNTDVSLGLHAIAYLLWGERQQRPPEDFAAATEIPAKLQSTGLSVVDLPANRRRSYLTLLCNLLTDDLAKLQQQWNGTGALMPAQFLQLLPQSRLQLLQQAGHHFLANDLLALQLAALLSDAGDRSEAVHNLYAGESAAAMAAGIEGLQQLLLAPATGLGNWLLDDGEREQLGQALAQAQTLLQTTELRATEVQENGAQSPALKKLRDSLEIAAALLDPTEIPAEIPAEIPTKATE